MRLTTAQALVAFLRAQWTERDGHRRPAIPGMFGIFGHGNVCSLSEALAAPDAGLTFHQGKNEQSMVHAAIGYAKAQRRLATLACTASIGPGATNLVTGAATATTNRLPVLLLPADTFAGREQGPVLQQLQHACGRDVTVNDCLRPVSRFFDRIARPEQLLDALPAAMRTLFDPADTGAVTVALHQDVLGAAYDYPAAFFAPRVWRVPRRPPEAEVIRDAAALLRRAQRPLVIAGGGVRHSAAEEALAALAERCGLPVAETSAGKGSVTGPACVGGIGVNGTAAANELAATADVVLCVGTRLSDFTTASRSLFAAPDVRFVAINVDAGDAHALAALPVIADARLGLDALAAELAPAPRRPEIAAAVERWNAAVVRDLAPVDGERMTQGQVYRTLNAACRRGDWVVAAAGSPPGDLLKLWEVPPGSSAHIEFAFSCMGHELPAALGIRLADRAAGEIFAVIGDGTYLMAPGDLVTAVQEQLKVTVVVLVNGGYRSIEALQRATLGRGFGNEFGVDVDYAANARSFGAAAWHAETTGELEAALAAARAQPGPALIACAVEARRALLGSGAWWDLGVPEVSQDPRVRELAAAHARAGEGQRFYG
ncbi:MAG TPA: 3D-(3,5/4)-trihydroxycyclohexane-1,2-dione acylhydrolase (decyclizing) [Solirubrobacteraceae bacterium]|nr:3D-(3,5/4)-trihydroxycyclohexane-1,2-dione acylhydrolase (decyclizing) [Solirubrobacteraceae bacterium]